jgi:predicted phage-related endonuclease
MMDRGAAPGAMVHTWAAPRTPEWYQARQSIITATDVVAICDLTSDKDWGRTAYHVWLDKRGEEPVWGDSKPAKWGRKLEAMVGEDWAEQTPGVTLQRLPVLVSTRTPWAGFSPDFAVDGCPDRDGPCGAEVKTRSAWVSGSWRDDVPDDVLAQVTWGCMVAGWGHMHVPHLIGGQWDACHRVDYDEHVGSYLLERAAQVWQAVQDGIPPDVDPSRALTSLLDAMFPDRAGTALVPARQATAMLARYQRAAADAKDAAARKEAARHALIAALGDADRAASESDPDETLWTYTRPQTPAVGRITADDMRRLARDDLATHVRLGEGGWLTYPTPAPTLRLTKAAAQLTEDTQ